MIFGSCPLSPNELASLLITRVRNLADCLQQQAGMKENRAWTVAVKSILSEAGEKRDYEVLCCGVPGLDAHEWLLDMVWWQKHPEKGLHVSLACESEWLGDPSEVAFDFQKLLCIKAPLKLMIYAGGPTPDNPDGQKIRARLQAEMLAYVHHVEGEEYLLVSLDATGGYAHEFCVPADKDLTSVDFKLLELGGAANA